MGLFDNLREMVTGVDFGESHLDGHGFDPAVCEGCENHRTDLPGNPCDICMCPTTPFGLMDLKNAPPASCIRLEEHARGE